MSEYYHPYYVLIPCNDMDTAKKIKEEIEEKFGYSVRIEDAGVQL